MKSATAFIRGLEWIHFPDRSVQYVLRFENSYHRPSSMELLLLRGTPPGHLSLEIIRQILNTASTISIHLIFPLSSHMRTYRLRIIFHLRPPIAHKSKPVLRAIFDLEVFWADLTDHLHVPKHRTRPDRRHLAIDTMVLVPEKRSQHREPPSEEQVASARVRTNSDNPHSTPKSA